MKRFLICAGVHGRDKSLAWLTRLVEQRRPDGILFAGGVLDCPRQYQAKSCTLWGMTKEDGLFLERFFETLGKTDVYSAIIPGPEDTPLEEFVRLGMHAEVDFPNLHIVHATKAEAGSVVIGGIGCCLLEDSVRESDCCSRTMAEYYLRPFWNAKHPKKILLLPEPPPGILGDNNGNNLVGAYIDSFHPSLCVVKGSSECRGMERVGHTMIINPGCLADGFAAWLDWNRKGDDQIEFIDKQEEDRALLNIEIGVGD